jgi:hypothetical protein
MGLFLALLLTAATLCAEVRTFSIPKSLLAKRKRNRIPAPQEVILWAELAEPVKAKPVRARR